MRHGEERWTGIESITVHFELRKLAAGIIVGFVDLHMHARRAQANGSRQAGNARTDNDDVFTQGSLVPLLLALNAQRLLHTFVLA